MVTVRNFRFVLAAILVAALCLMGSNNQAFAAEGDEGFFVGVHAPATGTAVNAIIVSMSDGSTVSGEVYVLAGAGTPTAQTTTAVNAFADSISGTDVTLTPVTGMANTFSFSADLDEGDALVVLSNNIIGIRLDSGQALLDTMFGEDEDVADVTLLFVRDGNDVALSVVNEDREESQSLSAQIWAKSATETTGSGPAEMFNDDAEETTVHATVERLARANDTFVGGSALTMTQNDGWLVRNDSWTIGPRYALSVGASFDSSTPHDLVLVWGDSAPVSNDGGNDDSNQGGNTLSCSTAYVYNTSSLNVRTGPGTSYSRNGSLARGERVTIISQSGGWSQVAVDGWASNAYLTCTAPTNTSNNNNNGSNVSLVVNTNVRVINPIGNGGVVSVGSNEIAVVSVWCNGSAPRGAQDEFVFLIDDGTSPDLHSGCNGSAWVYDRSNFEVARAEGRAHAARIGAGYSLDTAFQDVQNLWGLYFSN